MKVVEVDEVVSLFNDHITDKTGIGRLDLWQDYVSSVSAGKSYSIKNAIVKGRVHINNPKE